MTKIKCMKFSVLITLSLIYLEIALEDFVNSLSIERQRVY